MDEIKESLENIMYRIDRAAKKSGRTAEDITLVGVTKTVNVERIKRLAGLGVQNLGENRVQELTAKFPQLEGVNWHMIGHLQTNKVKYIIDKVCLIHSVDSIRLAEEINKRAKQNNIVKDILIEINIASEPAKSGIAPEMLEDFAREILKFDGVRLRGLMCVAPFVEKPDKNRNFFIKMRNLCVDILPFIKDNSTTPYLSMGMSNDFEVAIEEGANMVRIGTGIFGGRNGMRA